MATSLACRKLLKSSRSSISILQPSLSILHEQRASVAHLGEVNKKGTDEPDNGKFIRRMNFVLRNFVPETKKFVEEQKLGYTTNVMLEAEHGNYQTLFRFDNKATVDSWIATADKDNNQGKSSASFVLSQNKTGLFRGYLNKEVPKDGEQKYAGYTNIMSPTPMKSYGRETHWDWSLFNCLILKVRGDGRPYKIVIGCDFQYSINWLSRWTFPLFTRGGPYWQVAKIPFSKFYVGYRGRIQDRQEYVPLNIVNSLGITLSDEAEGPFCLEIEYIGVMYDVNLSGKLAYELYHDRNFQFQT